MEKYENVLTSAARAPDTDLALLAVEALKLGLTNDNLIQLTQSEFFQVIIKRIASPDMILSDAIFDAISRSELYPRYPSIIEDLLREAAEEQGLQEAILRVLEVLVFLRKKVPGSSSVYHGLDIFLNSKDLLMQLCSIQIIIQNADNKHDFDILATEGGILESLIDRLPEAAAFCSNEEPIYCKTLNLCSNLFQVKDTDWTRFTTKLVTGIRVCLEESNSEAQTESIVAVGALTVNDSLKGHFNDLKKTYYELFAQTSAAIQIACLSSATIVVQSASYEISSEVVKMGIGSMGNKDSYGNLQNLCLSSIEELKNAAYYCLQKLSQPQQFATEMFLSADIFEFLTSRSSDLSPEGLKWKYDIIKDVLEQPWSAAVLNQPMREAFELYVSRGVHYNEAIPSIAFQ